MDCRDARVASLISSLRVQILLWGFKYCTLIYVTHQFSGSFVLSASLINYIFQKEVCIKTINKMKTCNDLVHEHIKPQMFATLLWFKDLCQSMNLIFHFINEFFVYYWIMHVYTLWYYYCSFICSLVPSWLSKETDLNWDSIIFIWTFKCFVLDCDLQ